MKIEEKLMGSLVVGPIIGLLGYLGVRSVQIIVPTAPAASYGLTFGLSVPFAVGLYAVLKKVGPMHEIARNALAIVGGCFAAVAATHWMGCQVTILGMVPIMAYLTACAIEHYYSPQI